MELNIESKVQGHFLEVFKRFDRDLFEHLSPKGAAVEVVEFTGSQKGDRVVLKFTSPIKADWISVITEDKVEEDQAYFIDEGRTLPWPLKEWRHKHIVRKSEGANSIIEDKITYKTSNKLLDLIIWPAMYFTFAQRKALYRSFFNK